MNKLNDLVSTLLKSPVLWGAAVSAGFYALIHAGVLRGEAVELYFAGHPVEYFATSMFFVALAVLVLKALAIVVQQQSLRNSPLGPIARSGRVEDDCRVMLERLDRLPESRRDDYFPLRLREAIDHVRRQGSAAALDDQLKYLADMDVARAHGSYALVRVIIWAIPILGFLGTVVGITMAIANLAGGSAVVDGAIEETIPRVVGGLSVAFATTTQALILSIVLMFAQYFTEQRENALLGRIDQRMAKELDGRFEQLPAGAEGELVAVRRMCERVVQAAEELVDHQARLWKASMDEAAARWSGQAEAAGEQLQRVLTAGLEKSLAAIAQQVTAGQQAIAQQNQRHWDGVQQSQSQQAERLAELQTGLVRQAEVLHQAIAASGEVTKLEAALNRNLGALAGAKHFEQTVMSLAAAIHLLNARLAEAPGDSASVALSANARNTQAA